ncbi:hypothetical protein L1987_84645 [Smallanthus sonchifolius]|uniref:Uncharacterized protein n=1 Tax=Smallanthus sonchifolius TaxID=185202 RepID=A0ACB8XUH7_9ASTR|nr:hypothetical protein L1987_84645 [Smallanthus sonchifolius]
MRASTKQIWIDGISPSSPDIPGTHTRSLVVSGVESPTTSGDSQILPAIFNGISKVPLQLIEDYRILSSIPSLNKQVRKKRWRRERC